MGDGQLPSEGWQWWDREAWRVDSATITISPQASTRCQRLELGSKCAFEMEETNCLGKYKPLCGSFCRGRQVFEQEGDGKHFLSVGKYGAWNIMRSDQLHAQVTLKLDDIMEKEGQAGGAGDLRMLTSGY